MIENDCCENCGKGPEDCDGVMTWDTNPYAVEINDDYTEYWDCEGSRQESAWDI